MQPIDSDPCRVSQPNYNVKKRERERERERETKQYFMTLKSRPKK
jgi:hypothetical protein